MAKKQVDPDRILRKAEEQAELAESSAIMRRKQLQNRQKSQHPTTTTPTPQQTNHNHNEKTPPTKTRSLSSGFMAFLVFIGSMTGTLVGTFASFNDISESVKIMDELVNPPLELCVVGSNTILGEGLGMAEQWEIQYEESNSDIDIVVRGIGSVSGVLEATEGGCVDVLAMSEPMTEDQFTQLTDSNVEVQCAAEIGYDIIAFVTDINSEVPTLLQRDLSHILSGDIRNWSEVGGKDATIQLFARPGSGTTELVMTQIGRLESDSTNLPNFYRTCDSNSDCLDKTLGTPGSLYWVSTAWMRTQPPEYLRVLPILQNDESPINPLVDDFNINSYPKRLVRPLYMYVLKRTNSDEETIDEATAFLQYIRSVKGQQILENNYFYTYFDRPTTVTLDFPLGFEEDETGLRPTCKTGM